MKRYQLTLAGLIALGILAAAPVAYSEEPKATKGSAEAQEPHGPDTSKGGDSGDSSSRPTSSKPKTSEKFGEIFGILEAQKDGATIVYSLKKDAETELSSVTLDGAKISDLKKEIESIKAYADQLVKCGESAKEDKVSSEMLKALNELIDYVTDQKAVGKFDTKGTLNEKELNTLVVRVLKALEEKATKFKDNLKDFEKADNALKGHIVALAKILQGGSWDKTVVNQEKVDAVGGVLKAIKDAESDAKMCKFEDSTGQTGSTASTEGNGATGNPAPPVVDPTASAGTTPTVVPTAPAATQDPSAGGLVNNQLQEALNEIRRLTDERDRERELQDEFLRRSLDQNNLNNDQALKALQGALNQAQRPNVSRGNSDRSEQGPQLSPSVSIPQGQQQPFPQLPQMQMPQQPPFPMNPMMNNGPMAPIMPYQPSRFSDDIPRPAVAPQPDPTLLGMLQNQQQQNQMFQQMMMSRFPYMGNGVQNVNGAGNVGQMLRSFGGGPRFGAGGSSGGPRLLPNRLLGNGRTGAVGRASINSSARAPIPSKLRR